jgi:hypothetical protein
MKAIFDYDPPSGKITDSLGLCIYMSGMQPFPSDSGTSIAETRVDGIVKLKAAGFTVEEIMNLR